jgi:hypothetical protein
MQTFTPTLKRPTIRGDLVIEVTISNLWDEETFLVPLNTERGSQHIAGVWRNDRRLPVGHRVRGDVLV